MSDNIKYPTVSCAACDGEGIGGEYVPELCGEGEDRECQGCQGSGRVKLPHKFEVCDHCEGRGTSSAYLGAYTESEWSEMDDEWKADYISGRFDRLCDQCNGMRVVAVVERSRCTPAQLERYGQEQDEIAETDAIHRAERAMGA